MSGFSIRRAQLSDQDAIAKMCSQLWPETSIEEHRKEVDVLLCSGLCGALPSTFFVSLDEEGALTGFLQAQVCAPTPTAATPHNPLDLSRAGLFMRASEVTASAKL